jgi:long-chain acyl-CoA synthetase
MQQSPSYPWFQHYSASLPQEITLNPHETLVTFLEETTEKYKHLPMLENMGKLLTYGEVDQLTKDFAAYLQKYTSLKPGDHVAIQLPNLLQNPIAILGALRAGMVVVNVNPLYTAYELEQQLKDAGAQGIIILANFAHNLASAVQNIPAFKTVIITEVGDMLGKLKGYMTNFTVKHIKKLVPTYQFPDTLQVTSFNRALRLGKTAPFHPIYPPSDATAFLQYTGGTTGVSKGVMLKHKHILANMRQMLAFMQTRLAEGKEIFITPLPLYHIFALTVNLWSTMQIGAKNVLITNPRDMDGLIRELRKHPFTCLLGVNTLFNALLSHPKFNTVDFSHLKISLAGGVALQDAVAEKWEQLTGVPLIEGYGLTEASPCVTCNLPNGRHRKGTIGIPVPSTQVKIVDENNQEVAPGQPGHLLVKGPQVMESYWNNPEETQQAFVDGWLQTGDIASMSPDGFIKILDRKKEMINVSGFNVYPNEIENVVLTHPKVLEAAAVATWEDDGKEAVKLFVIKKDPSLTVEELMSYCKQRLTNYKRPRYIEFRDSLPKSNVGKILRRVLQEEEKQRLSLVPKKEA